MEYKESISENLCIYAVVSVGDVCDEYNLKIV